ncbi:MAG: hypothetical protein U9R01_09565, partial [candidate division WOR-3 bacterium]|nr:hypothetical protein [candidate division WOR-3 bacterium]
KKKQKMNIEHRTTLGVVEWEMMKNQRSEVGGQRIRGLEDWNYGRLECWNAGILECWNTLLGH